jgi:hypothetical protein
MLGWRRMVWRGRSESGARFCRETPDMLLSVLTVLPAQKGSATTRGLPRNCTGRFTRAAVWGQRKAMN